METGLYLAELEALDAASVHDFVALSRPPSPPDSNVDEETGLTYADLEALGSMALEDLEPPVASGSSPAIPPPFSLASLPPPTPLFPEHPDLCINGEWVDVRMSAGYFPGFPLPGPGIRPLRALPAPAPAPAREHARIPRILANSRPLGSIPGHCGHLYHKCHHIHM